MTTSSAAKADRTSRLPPRASLSHRMAEKGINRLLLLLVPAAVFVAALFIYPFLYGINISFQPQCIKPGGSCPGGGPFANYVNFVRDPYQYGSVRITLGIGLAAALFNVLASVPIAYRMRGHFSGKKLVTTLLVIPITLGTVLTAEGMLNFLGPQGWFNRSLGLLGLEPLTLVKNWWGVFISLAITGFPFAFLLVLSYISGIDRRLDEAAATMGAGGWQRFRYITLPLLMPGLFTTFCLAFVLAFSVFPSANLVGDPQGTTRVMSIVAYQAANEQYDYTKASAIAMIMGLVEIAVIGFALAMRTRFYAGASGGKG